MSTTTAGSSAPRRPGGDRDGQEHGAGHPLLGDGRAADHRRPAQRQGAGGEVRAHPEGPGAVRRRRLGSLHGGSGDAVAAALAAACPEAIEAAGLVAGVQRVQRRGVRRGRLAGRGRHSARCSPRVAQASPQLHQQGHQRLTAHLRPADRKGRARIDDMLDCPLREFNLLGRSPATSRLRGQSESSWKASSAPAFAMPRSAA